jgi:hypothetical protein
MSGISAEAQAQHAPPAAQIFENHVDAGRLALLGLEG